MGASKIGAIPHSKSNTDSFHGSNAWFYLAINFEIQGWPGFYSSATEIVPNPMKLNSTATLTISLLALMAVAGLVSAAVGSAIGREALKGVTQPDTRPTSNLAKTRQASSPKDSLVILREEDILAKVKQRMSGAASKQKPVTPAPSEKVAANSADNKPGSFPMTSQSGAVTLEVSSAQPQGESFILNVTLQNKGKQPVQFLYSLLDVEDDRGQVLNASTDGLPSELAADGETFSGTISIPMSILNGVKQISLKLTDYPDQQIKLEITNIPISK